MKKNIHNNLLLSVLILTITAVGFSSCKSQKNIAGMSDDQMMATEVEDEEMDDVMEAPDEDIEVAKEPTPIKLTKEQQLFKYFGAIASASSTASANASIQEALTMFSSSEAPVLIVIYKAGSQPDYDEPTTIGKYLNYLKDTKSNKAQVEEMVYDANGRVKELVLKK